MKQFLVGLAVLAVVGAGVWYGWSQRPHWPKLETQYQAVLLDNGQVYYGKIERMEREFSVLTEVYYIQTQVDPETKASRSILVRRGSEWHAPNRSLVNTRHILMIEPVTPGSKVAELIAALKSHGK
jgi:hypothetical protein